MEIKEGYVQIGYDFKVKGSSTDCLFALTDEESAEEMHERIANKLMEQLLLN